MSKNFRTRLSFLILALLALIIVTLINVIMGLLSKKYSLDYDITKGAVYMPSGETLEEIKKIDRRVEINIISKKERFSDNSDYNFQADLIINKMAQSSDYISVHYIDYKKNPSYLTKFKDEIDVSKVDEGDLIISSDDKSKLIKTYDLFNYEGVEEGKPQIISSRAEEEILKSVLYVISENNYNIGIINGHDNGRETAFHRLITNNGYKFEEINLALENIAADTTCLMIISPKADFSLEEIDYLHDYLFDENKNKMLLIFISSEHEGLSNLFSYIEEWGIRVDNGTVFETDDKKVIAYQPFYPLATIVNVEKNNKPLLMPVSRPLSITYEFNGNYRTREVACFSETSGVRPFDAGKDFDSTEASRYGPIPAVVESEYILTDGSGRASSKLLVFSSSKMLEDSFINSSSLGNSDFILNVLSEHYETSTIRVMPKSIEARSLNISQMSAIIFGLIFVVFIPLLTFSIGLTVFFLRRRI